LIKEWKYPTGLLFGMGISNVGDWIYLIALNLTVLEMTGSPLAIAGLYIVKPLAALLTNIWAGSVTDRVNKRNLMIILDFLRAVIILILPFLHCIWLIYVVVFVASIASSMFDPASMTYITKLIPPDQRKRFNSLLSLVHSGAFLIGPAIAGVLFLIGTPQSAMFVNSASFFVSGAVTLLLPNLERDTLANTGLTELSWAMLKQDWHNVISFSRRVVGVVLNYFLFQFVMLIAASLDSLEVAFSKEVLRISDSDYGYLVSIAGAGIAIGAMANTLFNKKITTSLLIGFGAFLVAVGYVIYSFSESFAMAGAGFFVLAFFMAFANTGFATFYQNNIPVEMMGRIGSIYGFAQAILQIGMTVLFGIAAQRCSTQLVVVAGALGMLLVAAVLCAFNLQSSNRIRDKTEMEKSRSVREGS